MRASCAMTTFDPDTLDQDAGVWRRIQRALGGCLALNAKVRLGGTISRGDAVELVDAAATAELTEASNFV